LKRRSPCEILVSPLTSLALTKIPIRMLCFAQGDAAGDLVSFSHTFVNMLFKALSSFFQVLLRLA
jgi:hypothetical protein